MQNPTTSYPFTTLETVYPLYSFTTDNEIAYEIKFTPSTDYFGGYEIIKADIFEMVITVVDIP
jgi:hypothetical protein